MRLRTTFDVTQDGVGEADEIVIRTARLVVDLDQHDGRLRGPRRELGRDPFAERAVPPSLAGNHGVGTFSAHGHGRRTTTRRHRDDRCRTADLALERPGQCLDEIPPLRGRRPALEHHDLARPRLPAARHVQDLLQPPAEEDRHSLVQRWMEPEEIVERAPRQHEEHGIECDARGDRPLLTRDEHRLAEDLLRPVTSDHLGTVDDIDGARDDQVERVGNVAGLVDGLALRECDLPEETGDALALRLAQTTECGQPEETLLTAWTQRGPWIARETDGARRDIEHRPDETQREAVRSCQFVPKRRDRRRAARPAIGTPRSCVARAAGGKRRSNSGPACSCFQRSASSARCSSRSLSPS